MNDTPAPLGFVGAMPEEQLPSRWPAAGLRPHVFAGIFRMLMPDEKAELDTSVRESGLKRKITIFEDAILDGRNRYLSLVDGDVFVPGDDWHAFPDLFDAFVGTPEDALDLVWLLNEQRRHDSPGERAMSAARRKVLLEGLEISAKLRKTEAELATEHGVSERLLNSAIAVIENAAPEVQRAVDEGRMSVTDGADVSKLDQIEQRIIAENPDRKSVKAAVKATKKPRLPVVDLPSPISRTDLVHFAEDLVLTARAAFKKKGGKGASISADAALLAAAKFGIVDGVAPFGFTRSALLALGQLRDEPVSPAKTKPPETGPESLPLGGEWSLKVGGLKADHSASISAFHEEDDSYSFRFSYDLRTVRGGEAVEKPTVTLRDAIAWAAGRLLAALDGVVAAAPSESAQGSATDGAAWLRARLASWGIVPVDLAADDQPDDGATYQQMLADNATLKGRHTRQTAEPILRAAEVAGRTIKQVADDIGHTVGSIAGWRARLGLQKTSRNPIQPSAARAAEPSAASA